jgi:hypothetical protein
MDRLQLKKPLACDNSEFSERLSGRNWLVGDGAFAPEDWGGGVAARAETPRTGRVGRQQGSVRAATPTPRTSSAKSSAEEEQKGGNSRFPVAVELGLDAGLDFWVE